MPRALKTAPLALALILGLAFGEAQADIIATVTADITPEAGGVYLYSYTVTDAPASTAAISEFDLSLTSLPFSGIYTPPGAPVTSILMQTGFANTYTPGDPTISFVSTDASTDIQPGAFGTFSFTSTYAPVLVSYQLSTFDTSDGPVGGLVLAPATVPEPSSLVLSGFAALGFVGWLAVNRRRQTAV